MRTSHAIKPRYLLIAILTLALSLLNGSISPAHKDGVLALERPAFVDAADAAEIGVASIASEAGISAYYKASTTISLSAVRSAFRTIETETADYIIGSVPVANYPESEDAHVYVHTSGWILAYYLAADPVGKIFDWRVYHNTGRTNITTKLENTLAVVAGQAGVAFSGGTYYDFRYPNATHMMLIVEWAAPNTPDSCQVNLPGSYAYYERSWSVGGDWTAEYWLDGVRIAVTSSGWHTSEGTLTASQLLPDQFHTIECRPTTSYHAYCGLALVYRVP